MTASLYMNFEVLASEIVDMEIDCMTDENTMWLDEGSSQKIIDDYAFKNNMCHGFKAIMAMQSHFEACINALIRETHKVEEYDKAHVGYNIGLSEVREILRRPLKEKKKELQKSWSKDDCNAIKVLWQTYVELMSHVRNELTHYKLNYMTDSLIGNPEKWDLSNPFEECLQQDKVDNGGSKYSLGVVFTKRNMLSYWRTTRWLRNEMIRASGCIILPDAKFLSCDAKDGLASFVANREKFLRLYPTYDEWVESFGARKDEVSNLSWPIYPW